MIVFGELNVTREPRIETFVATAAQNVYTLADPASGAVVFTRNGQTMPTTAYTVAGVTVTFVPAGTGSDINAVDGSDSTIRAGDIITIYYFREV